MNTDEILRVEKSAGARPKSPATLSRRILVVEDDQVIRRFNADALIGFGYTVDVAEDGADAWDTLQINRYDLMVTDNSMPKVSGVELMGMLHGARMVLLVIFATGTVPDFTQYPWPRPAATLLKPYTVEELLTTVVKVLGASEIALVEAVELAPPVSPAHG